MYAGQVHCPLCHADDTKVVDSRLAAEGAAVRRRRTVLVTAATASPRSSASTRCRSPSSSPTAASSRSTGPRSSAGSSPPPRAAPSRSSRSSSIADTVEDAVRLQGSEVDERPDRPARARPPAHVDEVAYLRFASVYKNFDAAADFHREIELLGKLGAERDSPVAVVEPPAADEPAPAPAAAVVAPLPPIWAWLATAASLLVVLAVVRAVRRGFVPVDDDAVGRTARLRRAVEPPAADRCGVVGLEHRRHRAPPRAAACSTSSPSRCACSLTAPGSPSAPGRS